MLQVALTVTRTMTTTATAVMGTEEVTEHMRPSLTSTVETGMVGTAGMGMADTAAMGMAGTAGRMLVHTEHMDMQTVSDDGESSSRGDTTIFEPMKFEVARQH
jgi:hypothetical protein